MSSLTGITPTKLELDKLELFFHTHFVCVSSRNLQNWDRIIPYFRFKCVRKRVFVYTVATPLTGTKPFKLPAHADQMCACTCLNVDHITVYLNFSREFYFRE